jgi:hypothetical protein
MQYNYILTLQDLLGPGYYDAAQSLSLMDLSCPLVHREVVGCIPVAAA